MVGSSSFNAARDRQWGTRPVQAARIRVSLVFFLTGLMSATWAARIPAIKGDLALSDWHFAIALIVSEVGAIGGLQLGGVLVPWFGSRPALRVAMPAYCLLVATIGLTGNLATLSITVFLVCLANGVLDVGMNAHGIVVERAYHRPMLSKLHAMHPVGGVCGGGLAAAAAAGGIAPGIHFIVLAIPVAAVAVLGTRALLPAVADADQTSANDHERTRWLDGWTRSIFMLGGLAFCVTLAEASVLNWGGVYLHDVLKASPGQAAAGITVFLVGITIGRFAGDAVIEQLGHRAAFRSGASIVTCGFGISLLATSPGVGIAGFGVAGLGVSLLMPLIFSVGGQQATMSSGSAGSVARISTIGYAGAFTGPALIGALAAATSLTVA